MPASNIAYMRAYHERRYRQEQHALLQARSEQSASAHMKLLDLHLSVLFDLMQKQPSLDLSSTITEPNLP